MKHFCYSVYHDNSAVNSIAQGRGGPECDFIPTMSSDSHVTFESLTAPGSHIGVLPSGQITSPAQTDKLTDASHFRIKYMVSCVLGCSILSKRSLLSNRPYTRFQCRDCVHSLVGSGRYMTMS